MKPEYAGALKIIAKVAEDERNWRAGMQQVEELFHAADRAYQELNAALEQVARLRVEISSLETERKQLGEDVASTRETLDRFLAEVQERQRDKRQQLGILDARIKEKEQQYTELTARFNEWKKQLGSL
jgi:chromosome segregation ATPase